MGFADDIEKARKKMVNDVDEFRQAVTISLFNSVIEDTPVRSGRLRGNWQTNEGDAKKGQLVTVDESETENAPQNTQRSKDEVENVVQLSKPDSEIHLSNNLPYAASVEFGGSKEKAPEGMLRKNVARISQILRGEQ